MSSELLEHFSRYYMDDDFTIKLKSSTTHWCVARREWVNDLLDREDEHHSRIDTEEGFE